MAANSSDIDNWRKYFRNSNSNIFDTIENAIIIAASDYPEEFKSRRGEIAELLFTSGFNKCRNCVNEGEVLVRSNLSGNGSSDIEVGEKVNKGNTNSSTDDHNGEKKLNTQVSNNSSYDEAEFLNDVIEEENQIVGEVLRIKEVFSNSENESDRTLFDSLRKLQLMELTYETLVSTEIGIAIRGFHKHKSKQIRHLARTLIGEWKRLVDEWYSTTAAVKDSEDSPDSVKPSEHEKEEEAGLPSPPLDEGAFLTGPPSTMEFSKFFDGIDEDGNLKNNGELLKNTENRETGRKPMSGNRNGPTRKPQPHLQQRSNVMKNENKIPHMKKQETVVEKTKKPDSSGPSRVPRQISDQRANNGMTSYRELETVNNQRRPVSGPRNVPEFSDEAAKLKIEASKRKLHEGYQQVLDAKKQRTIQVMELHDLPKQGNAPRNSHFRSGGHNRNWSHGRR